MSIQANSKIISRIFGGIGNQLFIYAASRRLAIVNNSELVLDDISGFKYDHIYRRHFQLCHFNINCRRATSAERLEPFSRIRRKLKREWNKFMPFQRRHYLMQEGMDYDPRLLQFNVQGTVYMEGYWQAENYFKSEEAAIRNDLRIISPIEACDSAVAHQMRKSLSVAIHLRFFDQANSLDTSNNVSLEYYVQAINFMEQMVPGAHYFIFSDDINAARQLTFLPDDRLTFVSHNQGDARAYADLWLMTQCKHFIIANSTFSWWGAWLGSCPTKVVIAPSAKIMQDKMWWGFKGLLPSEWILV